MRRLSNIGCFLVMALSLLVPSTSEAGVIPWVYDAIFGPVGSLRYGSGYGGGYYGGYSYGAGYAPYSYAYGYGSSGCHSCGYSCCDTGYSGYGYVGTSYASSGCSSCASGNCGTGVVVNSAPSGTISPIPDTSSGLSRSLDSRLDAIERYLERDSRDRNLNERFTPYRSGRDLYNDDNSTIRSRGTPGSRRTIDSQDDPNYQAPEVRNRPDLGTGETINNSGGSTRPNNSSGSGTSSGSSGASSTGSPSSSETIVIPARKPAPTGSGPEAMKPLRMDSLVTSRAVAPRERQVIPSDTKAQKEQIAEKKNAPVLRTTSGSKAAAPTKPVTTTSSKATGSDWAGTPRLAGTDRR